METAVHRRSRAMRTKVGRPGGIVAEWIQFNSHGHNQLSEFSKFHRIAWGMAVGLLWNQTLLTRIVPLFVLFWMPLWSQPLSCPVPLIASGNKCVSTSGLLVAGETTYSNLSIFSTALVVTGHLTLENVLFGTDRMIIEAIPTLSNGLLDVSNSTITINGSASFNLGALRWSTSNPTPITVVGPTCVNIQNSTLVLNVTNSDIGALESNMTRTVLTASCIVGSFSPILVNHVEFNCRSVSAYALDSNNSNGRVSVGYIISPASPFCDNYLLVYIIIGAVLLVAVLIAIVGFCIRKRRNEKALSKLKNAVSLQDNLY